MKQGMSLFRWIAVLALVPARLAQELSASSDSTPIVQSAPPLSAPDQRLLGNVSDATAYRLFFLIIAKRPNADPAFDLRRRTAYLKHYFPRQLTAEQIEHLLSTADALAANFSFCLQHFIRYTGSRESDRIV
jgi:hypothetical protein